MTKSTELFAEIKDEWTLRHLERHNILNVRWIRQDDDDYLEVEYERTDPEGQKQRFLHILHNMFTRSGGPVTDDGSSISAEGLSSDAR